MTGAGPSRAQLRAGASLTHTAVIADAHIDGPGGPPEPLVEQLEGLPAAGCDHLLLLGDLFQVWIGFRKFETPSIALVVAALRRLRAAGVRIDYIEGNRDFFLAGSVYADAFDSVSSEVALEIGEKRILAVHGDGLVAADLNYRFWKLLSKNPLSRVASRLIPGPLARRMVHGTEERLAATNFKHKLEIPEGPILDYARGRLSEGYDELVLGHFHDAREWDVGHCRVRLLEAWFHNRRIHWLTV